MTHPPYRPDKYRQNADGARQYSKYLQEDDGRDYSDYLTDEDEDYQPVHLFDPDAPRYVREPQDDARAEPAAPPPVVFKNLLTRENKAGTALVKRLDMGRYGGEATKPNEYRQGGVRYLDAERRRKYEVTMGTRIVHTLTGGLVDTRTVSKRYLTGGTKAKPSTHVGAADPGRPRGAGRTSFSKIAGWRGALIWVALLDKQTGTPRFYTHVCKIHKFHHSSFGAGKSVAGAGEWVIVDGKLTHVSANSGHYRPDMNLFAQAVKWMTPALHPDTGIVLYDSSVDDMVSVPARDFLANPGGSGRWFVHVDQSR